MFVSDRTTKNHKKLDAPLKPARLNSGSVSTLLVLSLAIMCGGCSSLQLPGTSGLDLMSPDAKGLFSGLTDKQATPYQMADGTAIQDSIAADGSMTMETYNNIRQAKAQNAVVLQVSGREQSVRVLPLPDGGRSVFVSELLTQTGVFRRYGHVDATLYRQSPESISGIKMKVNIAKDGTIDPATDYGLRAGDRVQIRQRKTSALQMLADMATMRR